MVVCSERVEVTRNMWRGANFQGLLMLTVTWYDMVTFRGRRSTLCRF